MKTRLLSLLAFFVLVVTPVMLAFDFGKLSKALDGASKIQKGLDTAKDAGKIIKGVAGIGPEEENQIGDAVALEIIAKHGGLDRDLSALRRVNLVGRSLAGFSERPELEWQFGLLNSSSINAFSSPGGYVFITRGLYDRLPSDDMLAGALAHEIAHITEKHAIKIIERDELLSGLSSQVTQRSGAVRQFNADANQVRSQVSQVSPELAKYVDVSAGKLVTLIMEKGFDPKTEYAADATGRNLAVSLGFAPGGLRAVLVDLQAKGEKRKTIFSTHPPLKDRLKNLPSDPAPTGEQN